MKTLAEYIADACQEYGMSDKQCITFLEILRAVINQDNNDIEEISEEP